MARSKSLIEKRNKDILKEYKKLYLKYRISFIFEKLSEKFYLEPEYIQRIVQDSKREEVAE